MDVGKFGRKSVFHECQFAPAFLSSVGSCRNRFLLYCTIGKGQTMQWLSCCNNWSLPTIAEMCWQFSLMNCQRKCSTIVTYNEINVAVKMNKAETWIFLQTEPNWDFVMVSNCNNLQANGVQMVKPLWGKLMFSLEDLGNSQLDSIALYLSSNNVGGHCA